MLYFLSGEDWFRLRERSRELASDFEERHANAERFVFDVEENFDLKQIENIREVLSGGLFATPALVFIRQVGMIEESLAKNMKEVLDSAIVSADSLVIATHSGKVKKTHPLVAWLLKKGEVETFEPLTPGELRRYGETFLKKNYPKSSIDARALDDLIANAGKDTGRLASELTKLALYKNDEKITSADVKLLTQESLESNVFAAFDRLVAGRREEALVLLREEEKMNVPIQKTLGLCAWQLRRLIEVSELAESGMQNAGQIARELKSSPYMIQKILPNIHRFPLTRLKQGITLLAELDKSIRIGRVQPGVAIDLFVWKF